MKPFPVASRFSAHETRHGDRRERRMALALRSVFASSVVQAADRLGADDGWASDNSVRRAASLRASAAELMNR